MRTLSLCGLVAVVVLSAWLERGAGAPLTAIDAAEYNLAPLSTLALPFELKGQEETRVIASGARALYQGLYVFDKAGNCVAWDDFGGMEVREDSGVVFVPPSQGTYRIEVRSYFPLENGVRVVVR